MAGFLSFRVLNTQRYDFFGSMSGAFVLGYRGWTPLGFHVGLSTLRERDSSSGNFISMAIRQSAPDFDSDPDTTIGTIIANSPPDPLAQGDVDADVLAQDGTAATACAIAGLTGDNSTNGVTNLTVDAPNDDMILVGGGSTGTMTGFVRMGGGKLSPATLVDWANEAEAQIEWPLDGEFQFFLGVAPNESSYDGSTTWSFVLRINGADAIVASGLNTDRFFTNDVTVASINAGDLVALEFRKSGPNDILNGADIIIGFRPA